MIKIRGILEEEVSKPPLDSEKDGDELKITNYSDALTVALKMLEDLASGDDYK